MNFVKSGDAVQKPHVMTLAVVFDEREMWVVGFRVAGRQHRFFEGEFLGRLAFNPIIAIAANRDDGAVWVESLHALVESFLEPALAGDTARTALLPMLAVSHEQHKIGDMGVGRIRPAVVVKRYGEHDDVPVRRKRSGHFSKEEL